MNCLNRIVAVGALVWLLNMAPLQAVAKAPTATVVARASAEITSGSKVVATVEKGAVLTVLQEDNNKATYLVQTGDGTKGWIRQTAVANLADATDLLGEAIRSNPRDAHLYAVRAGAWAVRGDAEKAIADYDKAIGLGPADPRLFLSRGVFHASAGRYDRAIADYDRAEKLGLKDASIYTNRAAARLGKGEPDRAIEDCNRALRKDPKSLFAYYQRAVAWKSKKQHDKAIADLTKLLQIDPKNLAARSNRGFLWFLKGDSAKAISDFDEVIRLDPKAALAYNNRGYNRRLKGDYPGALSDYNEAIRLAPEYALAYQNKAWLLAACPESKIRNGSLAVTAATRACELRDWKDIFDLKGLAAAFAEADNFEEAVKWQKKVVEMTDKDLRKEEQEVLALYEAKKPYRFRRGD